MNRIAVFLGTFLIFLSAANAKFIKVRGYVTEVVAEDAFYIEDIRIVLNEGVFPEMASEEETDTHGYSVADLRVGSVVEVRGNQEIGSEEVQAESIRLFAEDYRKVKRTALIERAPSLEKTGDSWIGEFFADGQRIRATPSTVVTYQPNKSERKAQRESEQASKRGKASSTDPEEGEPSAEPLHSLDQIGPNTFMTYEGVRGEDGTIEASSLVFERNELTWNEGRWKRILTPTIKEPLYERNKPGRLRIPMVGSLKLVPSREAQVYIQRLGYSLIPPFQKELRDDHPDKIDFRFYLVKSLIPNAFALPNGVIVVYAPLLSVLENEAQLAFVLSHEIAHTVQEHYRRQKEYHRTERTLLVLGSIAAVAMGVPAASDALSYAERAIASGYSRHLENQADRMGLTGLARLGYDLREAPEVWKLMARKMPSRPQFFWASHAKNTMRRSFLMAELRINYAEIHYPELKTNKEAFEAIVSKVKEAKLRKKK